jgi:hypothetical protein
VRTLGKPKLHGTLAYLVERGSLNLRSNFKLCSHHRVSALLGSEEEDDIEKANQCHWYSIGHGCQLAGKLKTFL